MAEWTTDRVEERLREAADVLRRLPDERIRGYFSTWPRIVHDFSDLVGQEAPRLRRPPPAPDAIDRMEQVFPWLGWLEPDDGKLVWMRVEGTPWKGICWRFGIGRATAHRRWEYALSIIAWRLNGRPVPRKRSRQFVVRQMRLGTTPRPPKIRFVTPSMTERSRDECTNMSDRPTSLE